MAPCHSRVLQWQSSIGRDTVRRIVKERIPEWTEGLRDWQLDVVCRILDGEDVLISTATGDGKSAIFAVPLVVLLELQRQPMYYADLPRRALPMGIVITPTKGLAGNIVFEINKLGVGAIAYCSEVLTEARKTGRHIWKEIASGQWPLVCVDLEHLTAKDWEYISNTELWRKNFTFLCVDEIHLIYEWGADFRPAFRNIGMFARSRCPPNISVFGLSATMEPGLPMSTICDTMGFVAGHFYHLQRTNERPNIHFILQTLTHTLGGETFPDLLAFLSSGRKTVIYCATIELCWRVAVYLWSLLPPGLEKLKRVRLYHAMCWPDENEETIRLIRDDPRCQVVIATIAFAQGFNVKPLLDSVQLGIPSTMNQLVQQEGRIGRDLVSLARSVVLVQAKAIEAAERYMRAHFPSEIGPPTTQVRKTKRNATKKKASKTVHIDHAKARLLVEQGCIIALRNIVYRNPPLEMTARDCIAASRPVPCSRCLPRTNITLDFPASPVDPSLPLLVPFCTPSSLPLPIAPVDIQGKAEHALTAKMRESVTKSLGEFRDIVRKQEKGLDLTGCTPRASYFPASLVTCIVTNLLSINSTEDVANLIPTWTHLPHQCLPLFNLLTQLQMKIRVQRDTARLLWNEKNRLRMKSRREAQKGTSKEDEPSDTDELEASIIDEVALPVNAEGDDGICDNGMEDTVDAAPTEDISAAGPLDITFPGSTVPSKRPALQDDTNGAIPKHARRAVRAPLSSSAIVSQSYRPLYRTRPTRSRGSHVTDENQIL
ncbi:ATP-dependent DNA helicase RecQ [Hypsizygus marmoreus]|uniref:DNA 3'-5' helicase n=1 Tax=Hypsizygus marmoreus TaxID=39966 RepID=A0A369J485_HYPMA|nr:ATP-dependent DNA helicase RecQ [Hypsizygus marmoreus]